VKRVGAGLAVLIATLSLAACSGSSGKPTSSKPKENAEVYTDCSLAGEKECSRKAREAEVPATPSQKKAQEAGFRSYAECKAAEGSDCLGKGAEAEVQQKQKAAEKKIEEEQKNNPRIHAALRQAEKEEKYQAEKERLKKKTEAQAEQYEKTCYASSRTPEVKITEIRGTAGYNWHGECR
jgi:hypothetical protein